MNAANSPDIVLEARDIRLSYQRPGLPPLTVLRDFSVRVAAGEVIAILGPSGVGKSSLLRVLAGLQAADQGTVSVRGKLLGGPHHRSSFVFQDPSLLPWLTLEENVGFGLDFKHQPNLTAAQLSERVQSAIAEVGLQGARARYPSELSGGMAQRAALARALARQPEMLLLDEPFSALDEITRGEMQQLLQEITARHGTTALLVTHDIDEALLVSDRILLVGDSPGRIIGEWRLAQAHPRDLLDADLTQLRIAILQRLREARAGATPASTQATENQPLRAAAA